jgi:tetratricopeptide (TPR) repeat protein
VNHACPQQRPRRYLRLGKPDEARKTFMVACEHYPCAAVWAGLGEAYLRLGLGLPALDAFTEANVLDSLHPAVWGWLALACLGLQVRPPSHPSDVSQPQMHRTVSDNITVREW